MPADLPALMRALADALTREAERRDAPAPVDASAVRERVARALRAAHPLRYESAWEEIHPTNRDLWFRLADAAIAAIQGETQ